ncbi:hypothetical protein JQU44_06825 [Ponticoccus sp. SC2-30]|uniref:MYXO-CTERM sorting domain-containing protein n=1 Tax=Alexandriicola marinus TaxID=2081710 RepID=UPI000FDB5502|nr:MYXO-CTERM sorting domain-containing protein [Alexandriicola marinus]MBM1220041.1 hypothetical protein [Ponticoccus sp. SC6-9]MBM1224727.1 hypothetical protein [Ponticoccus sp. SC6-15]MBM1228240.1 hypothetical protein [Ponticoccus sp. SC6-38]MBM1238742.1 hypothetical protein [Ponticoccus sp. SC6-49]MBM1242523.1 hypothetical protein [Ponticoccus sp. SC2-64]MBM1251695.1 hypothetical protein [Ponticoccus sp. SC6-33]MBM1256751.1 hypothetical protein [Ponticoccus sp. SC6-60]MBM1269397.1 hypot
MTALRTISDNNRILLGFTPRCHYGSETLRQHKTLKGTTITLAAVAASGASANIPDEDIITHFEEPDTTIITSADNLGHDDDLLIDPSWFHDESEAYDVAESHHTYFGGGGGDNIITTPSRPLTIRDKLFSGNMMGGLAAIAAVAVLGWGWLRRRRKG